MPARILLQLDTDPQASTFDAVVAVDAGADVLLRHGGVTVDTVVPLKENSGEIARQYEKLGGKMVLKVAKGQGHNLWEGFFQCQELVDFVIARSKVTAKTK